MTYSINWLYVLCFNSDSFSKHTVEVVDQIYLLFNSFSFYFIFFNVSLLSFNKFLSIKHIWCLNQFFNQDLNKTAFTPWNTFMFTLIYLLIIDTLFVNEINGLNYILKPNFTNSHSKTELNHKFFHVSIVKIMIRFKS